MAKAAKATNTNLLAGLGTQIKSKSSKDVNSNEPLYTCNKIIMRMNKGEVAVAGIVNEQTTQYIADRYYTKEAKSSSVPNVVAAVCEVMTALKEDKSIQQGKTVIAVPSLVAYILNNVGLLARMGWTGLNLISKDQNGNPRIMAEKEAVLYAHALELVCECAPYICIMNSDYTHKNPKTATNKEQEEWTELNMLAKNMLNDTDPDDEDIDEDEMV